MKLYNLYQELIIEETQRQLGLITEAASMDNIRKAIEDRYTAWIKYRDYDDGTPPSDRYVQIYVLGSLKSGNKGIRVYQTHGQSAKSKKGGWKTFRVDRIESINLTNQRWWNPISDYLQNIPPYNQLGDDSFVSIDLQVDPSKFSRQRSTIPKTAPQPEEPLVLRTPDEPESEKDLKKAVTRKKAFEPGKAPEKPRSLTRPEEPEVNVATGKPRPRAVPTPTKPVGPTEPEIGNKEEEL